MLQFSMFPYLILPTSIFFSSPEDRNVIVSQAEALFNDLGRDEKEKAKKADFYVKVIQNIKSIHLIFSRKPLLLVK